MKTFLYSLIGTLMIFAGPILAQWQIGPVYPEKPDYYNTNPNYNPFRYNSFSGRYDYVPIPYDRDRSGGPNYDPYRFNWHRGGWDYRPWPDGNYDNNGQ